MTFAWRVNTQTNECSSRCSSASSSGAMKPSRYFARQCSVGIELEEPCLRQVIDVIGADRLLFGSDFPRPDHLHFPTHPSHEPGGGGLTEPEQELLFERNARAFFEEAL
jgi:predicted TIM-barrel fold metal-dependent hydrolase